ncbi:MAG: glycoside hydrolase family 30 beta sandwich domain-containing protein, partial [Phycisphaerae bacterium]
GFNGAAGSSLDDYLSAIDDHSHVYGYAHHLYNINAGDNPDLYLSAMLTLHNNWGSKPLFQTEYEKSEMVWPDAYNIALLLHNSLTVEELSGYLYWDLFWGTSGSGFAYITSSSYTVYNDYYGFKQYSAFIHSGWQRVDITDDSDALRTSAYISPDNSQLTVVAINTSTDTDIELDLSFTGFTIQSGQVYRTSQTQNCVNLGSYSNPVTMPARSVTTLSLTSGGGDTEPPAAPTGLSATGGELSISLNWDDNTEGDLAGYNVYRSQTSGSGYAKINGPLVTASNYTDNSVDAYETYYYVVTAQDTSSNESGNSTQASASATDTTPPAAPTGLSAVPSDATVTLNWSDSTEGDLEGYNVYRSTTSGSGYTQLNGSLLTTSNYTDNSVTNGTTYYYVVTAEDTYSNESGNSSEVSATPSPITTYTFAGITAANTEYNAYACDVDVFPFAGSSSNRNSMVEATDAQYTNISTDDSTEWTTVDPSTSDEILLWMEMKINEMPASISNIDLTFDGYTAGYGSVTHRIYVLTAGADWTLTSSWTQVGSDQSIPTGSYAEMTRSITSDFSDYIDENGIITWAVYETTSSQPMHVNYLEMKVTGMADTTPPAAPTGLAATAGDGTVLLNWDDNGEEDFAFYNVKRSETSGSGYSTIAADVAVSEYTDNTVTNDTTYYYVVTAVDTSDNESGNSSEDSATPEDTTAPAAPTGLSATAGDGTVSLNWDDNGETDLAGYNVKRSTTQGSGYSSIATDVATSDYTDNTVTNGTTYYYVVTAVDESDNESGNSDEDSATPIDTTAPAAPANLSTSGSDGFVSLDWADNTEPDLDGYNVYRSTTQGSGYSPIATDVTDSDYLDNAVTNGTTYYYVVTAIDNLSNESDNSNEASATPQDSTAPAAPVNLTAAAGNESVSLDWNDNIEPDLASYNIYRSDYSGGGYVLIDSTLAGDSQYVDNGATNFVTSYYVVTAVDGDDNESGNSNEASATPVYQTCTDVQAAQAGLVSDLTGDCYVDLDDLQIITNYWLEDNCAALGDCEGADFGPDGDVDFEDYSDFAVDWLECDNPADGNCPQSWWPTE